MNNLTERHPCKGFIEMIEKDSDRWSLRCGVGVEENVSILQITFFRSHLEVFLETVSSLERVDGRCVDRC